MKLVINFCLALIFLSTSFSCTKAPINGWLDGQWEVVEVTPDPLIQIINQRLYYNFSLHVCMLSYYGGTTAYANMKYDGDYLSLDFNEEAFGGKILAIKQYGIFSNPVIFKVNFTDSHHLILSNDESKVVLVKH